MGLAQSQRVLGVEGRFLMSAFSSVNPTHTQHGIRALEHFRSEGIFGRISTAGPQRSMMRWYMSPKTSCVRAQGIRANLYGGTSFLAWRSKRGKRRPNSLFHMFTSSSSSGTDVTGGEGRVDWAEDSGTKDSFSRDLLRILGISGIRVNLRGGATFDGDGDGGDVDADATEIRPLNAPIWFSVMGAVCFGRESECALARASVAVAVGTLGDANVVLAARAELARVVVEDDRFVVEDLPETLSVEGFLLDFCCVEEELACGGCTEGTSLWLTPF